MIDERKEIYEKFDVLTELVGTQTMLNFILIAMSTKELQDMLEWAYKNLDTETDYE